MLSEHKAGLVQGENLRTITQQLEQEENERHKQRLQEIISSAEEAQLFHTCLHNHKATEAGIVARAYVKSWAAEAGLDYDETRERKQAEDQKLQDELRQAAGE